MKEYIRRLFLYIPLSVVLLFLAVWGTSLLKCEILTNKYSDELKYAHIENTMIGKINWFKVLKCNGVTAEVYYVCDNNNSGNVLKYKKENDQWKEVSWDCIWSKKGNADEMLWPYWWHTYSITGKSDVYEDNYSAVLNNRLYFICENGEAKYLKNFFYGGNAENVAEPCRYAYVDFDGDGYELVVDIAKGNAYLVLNNNGDCVYGYLFYSRELQDIMQDGIFKQSSGAEYINYCRITFDKNNYKIHNLAVCDNYRYEIDGESSTKADFDDFVEKQKILKNVEWISIASAERE